MVDYCFPVITIRNRGRIFLTNVLFFFFEITVMASRDAAFVAIALSVIVLLRILERIDGLSMPECFDKDRRPLSVVDEQCPILFVLEVCIELVFPLQVTHE